MTAPARASTLTRGLLAAIAVAVLVMAVAAGWFWGNHSSSSSAAAVPSASSVDAGFARDMSVHHRQAVTMTVYELAHGSNEQTKLYATDINSAQDFQLGQMQGWLQTWGLSPVSAHPMSWMGAHMASMVGANGLMPGMASPAQMSALEAARGKAEDVLFLQLMIRHHQGGIAMANYAAQHATVAYVRSLAQGMANLQTSEIAQMEQTLRQLGGTPLAPPMMN